MGCDINGVIEFYDENISDWQKHSDIELGRNYNMFAAMDGDNGRWFKVNDDTLYPMTNRQGLPLDLSLETVNENLSFAYRQDKDIVITQWIENIYEYMEYHGGFWLHLDEIKNWQYWNYRISKFIGIELDESGEPKLTSGGNRVLRFEQIPMWKYVEPDGFWDMVGIMEDLVEKYGNNNCRAVFWYDG